MRWPFLNLEPEFQLVPNFNFSARPRIRRKGLFKLSVTKAGKAAREGTEEGTGNWPDYSVNRVLSKNEGRHAKNNLRKSRNSCWVKSESVGAHGQVDSELKWAQSWNQYKRSKNTSNVTSVALSLATLGIKLLELPALSPLRSPGTLDPRSCLEAGFRPLYPPFVYFVPSSRTKPEFWISTRTGPCLISQVLLGCRVRHPQYSKKLFGEGTWPNRPKRNRTLVAHEQLDVYVP